MCSLPKPEDSVTLSQYSLGMCKMAGMITWFEIPVFLFILIAQLLLIFHLNMLWCPIRSKGLEAGHYFISCVSLPAFGQACIK